MSLRLRPEDRYPGRIDKAVKKPNREPYDITRLHRYFEPVGDEERSYIAIACNSRAELIKALQALEDQTEPAPTHTMIPESTAHRPPYIVDQEPEK